MSSLTDDTKLLAIMKSLSYMYPQSKKTQTNTYTTTYMNVHTVYTSYIIAIINFVKII